MNNLMDFLNQADVFTQFVFVVCISALMGIVVVGFMMVVIALWGLNPYFGALVTIVAPLAWVAYSYWKWSRDV